MPPLERRPRTRFLKRYILPSDSHSFIGRVFDLGIVAYHFETYEELSRHADCKYAFDVNIALSSLTRRVESLNFVGSLLWPEPAPDDFSAFPVSRHEWLTIGADVFLMRYVSVVDCALLLTNEIFECGIEPKLCSLKSLRKAGIFSTVAACLKALLDDQGALRDERNARFHHGSERGFTLDNQTFQIAALWEHRGSEMIGIGQDGRRINVSRSFKEGLVELQREFNQSTRQLVSGLDELYGALAPEFESRFEPRFRVGPFRKRQLLQQT